MAGGDGERDAELAAAVARLRALDRRRRRAARQEGFWFSVVGIGVGSLLYILRTRLHLLAATARLGLLGALVAVVGALFVLATRTSAEVARLGADAEAERARIQRLRLPPR